MSDIIRAVRDFLVTDTTQPDAKREEGRQEFQTVIAQNVFDGRLRRCPAPRAVVLTALSDNPEGAVDQPVDFTQVTLDIELYMRDTDESAAAAVTRTVSTALRKWLHKYRGPLNGTVKTDGIFYETGPILRPLQANDASGNWKYRSIITYRMGVPIATPAGVS